MGSDIPDMTEDEFYEDEVSAEAFEAEQDAALIEAQAAEIDRLRAEVERLTKEALFTAITVLPEKDAEYATLRAENEKLRAALEWYASDVNWLNPERARAALAEEKKDG